MAGTAYSTGQQRLDEFCRVPAAVLLGLNRRRARKHKLLTRAPTANPLRDFSDARFPSTSPVPCSTPLEPALPDTWCQDNFKGLACCVCGGDIMGVVVWSPLGAVHHGCRTVASHTIFSQQVAKELAGLRKKQKRDRRVAHLERFEAAATTSTATA